MPQRLKRMVIPEKECLIRRQCINGLMMQAVHPNFAPEFINKCGKGWESLLLRERAKTGFNQVFLAWFEHDGGLAMGEPTHIIEIYFGNGHVNLCLKCPLSLRFGPTVAHAARNLAGDLIKRNNPVRVTGLRHETGHAPDDA